MSVGSDSANRALSWQVGLAATVLGIAGGSVAALLAASGPVPHPAAVVGELTYLGRGKAADFAFAYAVLIVACISYLALDAARRRLPGQAGSTLERLLVYASLPAVFWFAGQVLGGPFRADETGLAGDAIWLSALLTVVSAALCVIASRVAWPDPDSLGDAVVNALLAAGFAALSAIGAATAAARIFPLSADGFAAATLPAAGLAAIGALLLWLLVIARPGLRGPLVSRRLVVLAQLGLPLCFFALVLPPASVDGQLMRQAPVTPALLAVVSLAALGGFLALTHAWRHERAHRVPAMSVAAVVALALFADGTPIPYGMDMPADLYHHGEWLIPWDQWRTHGLLPYLDYSPSHGLINYLDGLVNDVLMDGTLAGFAQARQVVRAAVLVGAAAVLCRFAGPLPTLLALLLFPVTGRYTILLLVLAGFCLLALAVRTARPVSWLVLWALYGTALVFLAPGQGAMFVVAWAPTGVWQLWRAVREEPRRLATAAMAAAVLAVLAWLPERGPGSILLAEIRFILENRPLYAAVHGLDWRISLERDGPITPAFFEALRNLWIVALAALAVFAAQSGWRVLRSGQRPDSALCFAIAAALFLVLVVPHTIGRIDPGVPSRPGALSVFALALLCLPLIAHLGRLHRGGTAVVLTVAIGMLAPAFDHRPGITPVLELPQTVRAAAAGERFVDGREIGIPAFGRTVVPTGVIDRMVHLNARLDTWLDADETFLDMTNANADYFYLRRRVPIESGAVLTLPADGMQRRSVARLATSPPPVILLSDHRGPAGWFAPSLRAPILYRWVIDEIAAGRYGLWQDGPYLFAVFPERLNRAPLDGEATRQTLDAIFARQDLGRLPGTWGASADALLPGDALRADLGQPQSMHGVTAIDRDRFRLDGADPYLVFDVPESAADAGLLVLDVACADAAALPQTLKLYYATRSDPMMDERKTLTFAAEAGLQIVPLDAYPRILLDGGIRQMRIDFELPRRCGEISLGAVALYDRQPRGGAGR